MIKVIRQKIKILAKQNNIHFNQALMLIAYERCIERLSNSSNLEGKLIFKGGLVMRLVHGSNRYTRDLDASYSKLSENSLKKEVELNLILNLNDGFGFDGFNWSILQKGQNYEGIRLMCDVYFDEELLQKVVD